MELPFMWYSFPDDPQEDRVRKLKMSKDWKSADPWKENQQWWLFNLDTDPYETENILLTCTATNGKYYIRQYLRDFRPY